MDLVYYHIIRFSNFKFKGLKITPKKFVQLFYQAKYKYKCHHDHLTLNQILIHLNSNLSDFLDNFIKSQSKIRDIRYRYNSEEQEKRMNNQ